MIIEKLLLRFGYVKKSKIDSTLDFAFNIGKRLDEHRETVEAIVDKTNLFDDDWHIGHLATQDDYLLRLFNLRHGRFPMEENEHHVTGMHIRKRPSILGEIYLCNYLAPNKSEAIKMYEEMRELNRRSK